MFKRKIENNPWENSKIKKPPLTTQRRCYLNQPTQVIFLDLQSYSPEYNITFQPASSDISGIQDLQSDSSEYNIALQPTSKDIQDRQDLQSYSPE